jgi:heme-degrading monooxygenase HmoA
MEIILVHWLIKPGKSEQFEAHWKNNMQVGKAAGFYREILTKPVSKHDPKFNTFSITDKNYETYINIGIWESVDHFEAAIQRFFPSASEEDKGGKRKQITELEDFEFKIRERIVLQRVADRGGNLPAPTLVDQDNGASL